MIPILDKPPLHFAVDEATKSGIDHVILIASENQRSILQYFQPNTEIETLLKARKDYELLNTIKDISELSDISLIIQDDQLGLGHAIMLSKSQVGDESFAVLLPDDFIVSDTPTLANMMAIHAEHDNIVVALKKVTQEQIPHLGIVDISTEENSNLAKINSMVEKPNLSEAPSDIAIIGRYILPPTIFDELDQLSPGALGEIQLTDALSGLLMTHPCLGFLFSGHHFDVGTPPGLLKASIHMALKRGDIGPQLIEWIRQELIF
jgi:UTP--glucose-1-phosphate uridylyltransferase